MTFSRGRILELFDTGGGSAALVALAHPLNPQPGQYLRVKTNVETEVLPVTVFPLDGGGELLRILPISAQNWIVGQELSLRGPLGKGFHLPATIGRVGLFSEESSQIACLLPLAEKALVAGYEVALVTDSHLMGLPAALEVLPTAQVKEVIAWADYLAVTTSNAGVPNLITNVAEKRKTAGRGLPDEVLILTEMPCAGVAACGVCAVMTRTGWKYACKDGPVFSLAELVAE